MTKISVVMPVYNTKEEWLREAIESILNQTFADFEFIIINDGSTNNAEEVILSYKDKRIKYILQNNSGVSYSRNKGNLIAKGEYIAVMDSDDISLPNRFEKQVEFLDKNKDIAALGSWFEIFPEKQIIKHPLFPKYLDLLKSCCIGHPTVMYRKSIFEQYNFKYDSNYKIAHDYELWSRLIPFVKIANLQEVLLKYRWHGGNISKGSEELTCEDDNIKQNMLNFLTDNLDLQEEIRNLISSKKQLVYKPLEYIFSIKNSSDKSHKIVTLLGFHIKTRKKANK